MRRIVLVPEALAGLAGCATGKTGAPPRQAMRPPGKATEADTTPTGRR